MARDTRLVEEFVIAFQYSTLSISSRGNVRLVEIFGLQGLRALAVP